jgi:hypothetical protein
MGFHTRKLPYEFTIRLTPYKHKDGVTAQAEVKTIYRNIFSYKIKPATRN